MKTTEIIAERIQFGPRFSGGSEMNQQGPRKPGSFANNNQPEELPTINIDDSMDIKSEDLPF